MRKKNIFLGTIIFIAMWCTFSIITEIYQGVDIMMDGKIQIVESVLSVLAIWISMVYLRIKENESVSKLQTFMIGVLVANVYYISGGAAILLGVFLIMITLKPRIWNAKSIVTIAFVAVCVLEIYSILLYCYGRIFQTEAQQMMNSFILDIVLVVTALFMIVLEKKSCFINSILSNVKCVYTNLFHRHICIAVILIGVIASVIPVGIYQAFVKNARNAIAMERIIAADEKESVEEEYVRALRSPNILLEEGKYEITITYHCETNQEYELLHLDGTEFPPTILFGELLSDQSTITSSIMIPEDWSEDDFGFYLLYNGVGECDIEQLEFVSETKDTIVIAQDQFSAKIVGYERGPINGLYELYATYVYDEIPMTEHYQLFSSEYNGKNYTYKIYRIGTLGEKILVADDMNLPEENRIHCDLDGIQNVVVELFRRGNNEEDVVMEINNHAYVDGMKKSALLASIGTVGIVLLFGAVLIYEKKTKKKIGIVICSGVTIILLVTGIVSEIWIPKNQMAYACCYVALIAVMIVKGKQE